MEIREAVKAVIEKHLRENGNRLLGDPTYHEQDKEWRCLVDFQGILVVMGFKISVIGDAR